MATSFRHGVEVVRDNRIAPQPVGLRAVTAIGLVGTAAQGPVDEPRLVSDLGEGLRVFGSSEGTIPDALRAIYAQTAAPVVVVNAWNSDPDSPTTDLTAVTDEVVADAAGTARLANRPVAASTLNLTSSDGNTTYEAGTHFTFDAATGVITRIAAGGSYAEGASLKADYKWGDIVGIGTAGIVGSDGAGGAWALAAAETATGVRPLVLCAPGLSERVTRSANAGTPVTGAPVATGLAAVAERLRAVAVVDGPGTTEADAIAYAEALGSGRALAVDPKVMVVPAEGGDPVARPASGYAAGAIARSDREVGWWVSPSNRPLAGIAGVSRQVSGDAGGSADRLNAAGVATILRRRGYRLWGSRVSAGTGAEAFVSVRRIMDRIELSLLDSFDWAVDRNITADFGEAVAESVRAFLRSLQAPSVGAIVAGTCEPAGGDVNTDQSLQSGRIYFDLSVTPAVPAERITFRVRVGSDYGSVLDQR